MTKVIGYFINKHILIIKQKTLSLIDRVLLYGASRRIRTSDRSVRSRVLYPAELWMHYQNGGEGGIRTLDAAINRILP